MNIDNIRQLAEIMTLSSLSCIEVTENEVKIRLERETIFSNTAVQSVQEALPVSSRIEAILQQGEQVVDFNKVREIKSPMVGLFYSAPSPGKPPFAQKGDKIKMGDVLCIIEAMKMMNEIIAEVDGTMLDVCVQEGQLVEFSQVLFKIL